MVLEWTIKYPAYTGAENRQAYVYLPDYYDEDPERRFPVLYAFDGHNLFSDEDATYGKSWGLADYLDEVQAPLIVAAVECNHNAKGGRLSEYTPFDFIEPGVGLIKARGKETMNWFVKKFKRYIDKNFRTLTDRRHTYIMGSSMGGLMALYALMEYNHVFGRAAALSPSMEVDIERICKMVRGADLAEETVLYMDYGDREFEDYLNAKNNYMILNNRLMDRNIMLTSRIIPNGTHCEASWEKQLPFCINTLLYEVED